MRKNLFWLSDEQWKRIEPHLPTDVRGGDRLKIDVIIGTAMDAIV